MTDDIWKISRHHICTDPEPFRKSTLEGIPIKHVIGKSESPDDPIIGTMKDVRMVDGKIIGTLKINEVGKEVEEAIEKGGRVTISTKFKEE